MSNITVRRLLTHTSGIPNYTGPPGFFEKHSRNPLTPVEILKLTEDMADQLGHTLDVNQNVNTRAAIGRRKEPIERLESSLVIYMLILWRGRRCSNPRRPAWENDR